MVVFTCNNCGDSLQKPKVEKHYSTVCKTFKNLTCVDCLKDFKGEEYGDHIKCVSEKERYAAKGAPINVVNKGEVKQQQWSDMILEIINEKTDVTPSQKNVFNLISNQIINVPRKKMKFMNFIKNTCGNKVMYDDIESVWELIEEYKAARHKNPTKADDDDISAEESTELKKGDQTESTRKSKKKKLGTDLSDLESSNKRKPENSTVDLNAEISPKKKKKNNKGASTEEVQDSNLEKETVNGEEPVMSVVNGNTREDGQKKKKKKKSISKSIPEEKGEGVCTELTKLNEEKGTEAADSVVTILKDRIIKLLKKNHGESLINLYEKVLVKYCQETGFKETPRLFDDLKNILSGIDFSNSDKSLEESSKKRKPKNTLDLSEALEVAEISPKKKKKNNKKASAEVNGQDEDSKLEKGEEPVTAVVNGNNKKKNIHKENGGVCTEVNEDNYIEANDSLTTGTGSLTDRIIQLMKKKGNLSVHKLQKDVLKKYCRETGIEDNSKLVKKFNKLLKKIDCIEVIDDNVRLLQV